MRAVLAAGLALLTWPFFAQEGLAEDPVSVVKTLPGLTLAPGGAEPESVVVNLPALSLVAQTVTKPEQVVAGLPTLSLFTRTVAEPEQVVANLPVLSLLSQTVAEPGQVIADLPTLALVARVEAKSESVVAEMPVLTLVALGDRSESNGGASGEDASTWCVGQFEARLAQPAIVGQAGAPRVGREETSSVTIISGDCSRAMTLDVPGGTVELQRDGGKGSFVGASSQGGGPDLKWTFDCVSGGAFTGALEASDGNIVIRRDIEIFEAGSGAALKCP